MPIVSPIEAVGARVIGHCMISAKEKIRLGGCTTHYPLLNHDPNSFAKQIKQIPQRQKLCLKPTESSILKVIFKVASEVTVLKTRFKFSKQD
jgi:hypothetical protein